MECNPVLDFMVLVCLGRETQEYALIITGLTISYYVQEGNSGEDFNKDSIERDERRLTELGRRTVEIFVLAHIFR